MIYSYAVGYHRRDFKHQFLGIGCVSREITRHPIWTCFPRHPQALHIARVQNTLYRVEVLVREKE